ncbi:DUF4031 domain-containing protein [Litorihabitans aurantiacus]|uniref:DUF4031 domain-containing protein n=1 Tax=Litorihabitans aurantiacus TaxID=1930061 RepID=A0AA37UNV3_9MICO|nr:DUF4031 domain-containing protein [Litorihabitans aurantiacus]GMA30356.1 hypothetical protein GCM10025875_03480 [Litorihabitans aurantiacus]
MVVLLDPPLWPAHGTLWSHLVSDTSIAELHAFAVAAGVPARSFDLDHYDVPASRHAELVRAGAVAVDAGTLVRRLRASGLRRTERSRSDSAAHLRAVWADMKPGDADADRWSAVGSELLARWGEKGRLHHDRTHLREVLDAVDLLVADGALDAEGAAANDGAAGRNGAARGEGPASGDGTRASAPPVAVRVVAVAAWFHDAVHTSGRRRDDPLPAGVTDETASASLARDLLHGLLPGADVAETVRLVLLTQTHRPESGDVAGAVLSDADLSVLGSSPARYADYAAAIRAEYAHVPEDAFRSGRAAILEPLLDGDLFHTPSGRRRWETAARANLTAELARLRA